MLEEDSIHSYPHPLQGASLGKAQSNGELALLDATLDEEGIMRNAEGEPLRVSASDLERHAYCPMSWKLSRDGMGGQGEAIETGKAEHARIHSEVMGFVEKRRKAQRELVIWSWWYTLILAFIIDAVAFTTIGNDIELPLELAKYLALLSVVWLVLGMMAIWLPWRRALGMEVEDPTLHLREIDAPLFDSIWQKEGFKGGWLEGGRTEAGLMMGAIVMGIHAIGLTLADDRSQAGFILLIVAMIWTLLASWRLQKALMADSDLEMSQAELGFSADTEVAYSDDEESSGLLIDENTGLRGRPDQIVIIDGEFIPVEQKTGKVPKKPHLSHKVQSLAYTHLVRCSSGRDTPYGVIRYGKEDIHQIEWDKEHEDLLMSQLKEVQRLMVEGGAKRNHQREGKCRNCSRRYACPESLVS